MRADEAQGPETVARSGEGGRNLPHPGTGAEACAAAVDGMTPEGQRLMEAVVERGNLWLAYQRVVENKGAPGVDGLTVAEFKGHLKVHWPRIRQALLEGRYIPQSVRAVDIAKPSGGVRTLGIPTLVDRLIQQALNQVLSPIFEPGFSQASYGFRPGRSALQAVRVAQAHVQAGRDWVVAIDLEKFFDRVNHDLLMARLARRIGDERVLKLVRRYLEAGLMREGVVSPRTEGTPQGGPLSPLLSNILLTDWDRELETRGLAFVRYADDCNIYVGSEAAGRSLMAKLTVWLKEHLKLAVNEAKSAVARPWERKFLGYGLTRVRKLKIAAPSIARLKDAVREALQGAGGRSLAAVIRDLNPKLAGWTAYFRFIETKRALEDLDGWIRRRLRCRLWRQWKRPYARARRLMSRGLDRQRAWQSATNGRGPWWNSGASHMHAAYPKAWFDAQGLVSLVDTHRRLQRAS
jgi:RNA-directed DNA polymerase